MDEKKFSVKELQRAVDKMPIEERYYVSIGLGLRRRSADSPFDFSVESTVLHNPEHFSDLAKAILNWNWSSHSPHTDDAILVLVEELLEQYSG